MKITDRFVGDHKTFRKLITDLNAIAGKSALEWNQKRVVRLVELFKDHLIMHAWGEETFYYPAVRERVLENNLFINRAYMDHLDVEHAELDRVMHQLESQVKESPLSPKWPSTYQSFVLGLTAHMQKEETELFPFSEGLLGVAGLEEISRTLERRRREAPAIRRHATF